MNESYSEDVAVVAGETPAEEGTQPQLPLVIAGGVAFLFGFFWPFAAVAQHGRLELDMATVPAIALSVIVVIGFVLDAATGLAS